MTASAPGNGTKGPLGIYGWGVLEITVVISIGVCVLLQGLFFFVLGKPFAVIDREDQRVVPLFKELNHRLIEQIPPPAWAGELSRADDVNPLRDGGHHYITTQVVYYSSGHSYTDVLQYYDTLLRRKKWGRVPLQGSYLPHYAEGVVYSGGSSCVSIQHVQGADYRLYVWHDYWKQEFSPSWDLRCFWEVFFGFMECP